MAFKKENFPKLSETKIAVVGLGYVGLPLAIELGKKFPVVGFDLNINRIQQLKNQEDKTHEINQNDFSKANKLSFTHDKEDLDKANVYIVAVPTPVDENNKPNFEPLVAACDIVSDFLHKGDVVVFESTVFPGATREVCVPELEKRSKLIFNKDFFVGYSPERINPGDKLHKITSVVKITSGSTRECCNYIDSIYSTIIDAGTHKADSIEIAEAAKVIENIQRDVNIALINELSMLFDKLEIDTDKVLSAAKTKWNFLDFKPGLVGGHCIGVDPYYLTHRAEKAGFYPKMILSGREINDAMARYVATHFATKLQKSGIKLLGTRVLQLGFTFKENCKDIRNTKSYNLFQELTSLGLEVDVFDPLADWDQVKEEYKIDLLKKISRFDYSGVLICVGHKLFSDMGTDSIKRHLNERSVIYDLKNCLEK